MTSTALQRAAAAPVGASDQPSRKTAHDFIQAQKAAVVRAMDGDERLGDSMVRALLTEVSKTPRLALCTPSSLLGAVMTCAHLGLEPGPMKLVSLVPFRRRVKDDHGEWTTIYEVQIIVQYRGFIELAMRSKLLASIEARVVCENDDFDFEYGLTPKLHHKYKLGANRGDIIGFYGVADLATGGKNFLVMSVDEVNAYRDRGHYRANASDDPWNSDYAAMGMKTVIRRMEPFLPKSTKMARAFATDEGVVTMIGDELAVRDIRREELPPPEEPQQLTDGGQEAPEAPATPAPDAGTTEPQKAAEAPTEPPQNPDYVDGGSDGDPIEPLPDEQPFSEQATLPGGEPFE